jgi:phosphatidylserine/phosphatidylglycerophosphate/cardiolipin synthase-like enzyme
MPGESAYACLAVLSAEALAAVGSANLTPRSMLTSKEVTLFVHGERDAPFIRELRDRLTADIAESERITEPYPLGPLDRLIAAVSKIFGEVSRSRSG